MRPWKAPVRSGAGRGAVFRDSCRRDSLELGGGCRRAAERKGGEHRDLGIAIGL